MTPNDFHSQNDLQIRQEDFAAIIENMQEGLLLLNDQLQVVSINESAKKVLGNVPSQRKELKELVNAAQAGEAGRCIMEHESRKYSLLASPVVRGEQGGGVVIFLQDVTEQMEAERVRREFSANVSHELKTPLTSISGYAEIMKNGLVKPEDMSRFAGRIHKEAQRLISLVEDIIQLSRIEEGPADWQWESIELKELCQEIAEHLSSRAMESRIVLYVRGERVCVKGVRRLLEEMITNLCDNAIKYNREGGHVVMEVRKEKNQILLSVEDDGIGIPFEHQSRIFERFYRVDKSHSRETGGTGLGLSIVKHAAAIHEAQIRLDSSEGKGTCITVCFEEGLSPEATH